MDRGYVFLIILAVVILIIMMSAAGGSSSQGLQSGGKKKHIGSIGLIVAIFSILGISSYLQNNI